ncbi:uncharacterized protein B0H18DRAFT_880904 [Fomitopsis serialis]|uniref:uncharacterized protein n=1 Tax=Fomitopsis serialis TaxID=139415 RepID=UPI0020086C0D|nr:uncharacterized protein B0H18DRAFT_880904 [Neoantrodia serialis]KAH9920694.1 hypothetical protein B0H18DRAFT_880904 [Neoantrodia serialis]
MRYKDENICLIGVIPGPGKPSLEQINHFLRLLVDDLLEFWSPGIYFSRTALHPEGRFSYGFLIPLVSDQLAARQVAGLPSSSGNHLCSFCFLTRDQIEELDETQWPVRDLDLHRQRAMEWRDAPSEAVREAIFQAEGLRFTELLRLSYWDPRRFVAVDPMHAHLLGDLEDLLRDVWGADTELPSGLGKRPPGFKVPTCQDKAKPAVWAKCMQTLGKGSVEQLARLNWPSLWRMCYDRDLRRAGTKLMLARHLVKWVRGDHKAALLNGEDPTNVARPQPFVRHIAIPDLPVSLTGRRQPVTEQDVKDAEDALRTRNNVSMLRHGQLLALCARRDIRVLNEGGAQSNKNELIDRLNQHSHLYRTCQRDRNGLLDADGNLAKGGEEPATVVLGSDVLSEIWSDQERLVLPSHLAPGPAKFGSKTGKLKADQWRAVGTIHLVITLPRLWGHETGRKKQLLTNFMHLVCAVQIARMHSTSARLADLYRYHYKAYVAGFIDLYKEATVKPTNHLALHIADFLPAMGPTHSYRTWAFERMNFTLQNMPTNKKHGELEMTYMYHASRAANLIALMTSGALPDELADLKPAFDKAFRSDYRGSRLNDILGLGDSAHLQVEESRGRLIVEESIRRLLDNYTGISTLHGARHL